MDETVATTCRRVALPALLDYHALAGSKEGAPIVKRSLVLLTALVVLGVSSLIWFAWAQRPAPPSQEAASRKDEPATKFDRFVLKKGAVVVREYRVIGLIGSGSGWAQVSVARAYSPGDRDASLALRFEVMAPGRSKSQPGHLDADEVQGLQAALPQMMKMLKAITVAKDQPYTEVEFRGGTVEVGYFAQGIQGNAYAGNAYVRAGGIGGASVFFEIGKLEELEKLVAEGAAKLRDLQQQR